MKRTQLTYSISLLLKELGCKSNEVYHLLPNRNQALTLGPENSKHVTSSKTSTAYLRANCVNGGSGIDMCKHLSGK